MTPSHAALEIARRLDTEGPANTSALGLGLHEQKLKDQAQAIEGFCNAIGIQAVTALNQMALSSEGVNERALEEADA